MVTMNRNKVVIVGTGQVGATAAFGIVTHGLCNELVLIDRSAAKALGEARDLDDGSEFQDRHVKVRAGDYADCKDADIVVITVGRKPPANSNRMAELGNGAPSIEGTYEESHAIINKLAELGINLKDVTDKLEADGVAAFIKSWDSVLADVQSGIDRVNA